MEIARMDTMTKILPRETVIQARQLTSSRMKKTSGRKGNLAKIVLKTSITIMRWIRQERPLQLRAISMKRQGVETQMRVRLASIMLRKNKKMTIGATLEEGPKIIRWLMKLLLAGSAFRQGTI